MRNIFKRGICFTLSFILMFFDIAQAAGNSIEVFNRNEELIKNITTSSRPSDLPIVGVSDFFEKEKVHLINGFDLSQYIGKNIFVGYGIYDSGEEHCKFVEQPGVDKAFYDSVLHISANFNQHSYAVTQNSMNYEQCKTLAKKLGGYPVILDSSAEGAFVSSNFTKAKKDGKLIGNVWSGVYKRQCVEANYLNSKERNQNYLPWENNKEPICNGNESFYIQINAFGNFVKKSPTENVKCLIEFDSSDYKRPVRICSSWWRILRDYDGVKQTLYDSGMLEKINQADIPKDMVLCTKFDIAYAVDPATQPKRIAHCTEYYDRTIAPECVGEPRQAICKVDECSGYINNACTLVRKDSVGKEYVKGETLQVGKMTESRNKVDVVTKEFQCPAAGISDGYCTERSTVAVYPKECPGSRCEELKQCIYNTVNDPDERKKCYDTIPCIKIYGGRDIPPEITPDGVVSHLFGKCPDGTILKFPVNIQEKLSRKCLEYEVLTKKERSVEKCLEERTYQDHQVDMSITAKDIYEDDPNCIRLDAVHDSQFKKNLSFKITPKGYFKEKITEVNLDGELKIVGDDIGDDRYVISGAMAGSKGTEVSMRQTVVDASLGNLNKTDPNLPNEVQDKMPKCNLQQAFLLRNMQVFTNKSQLDANIDPLARNYFNYSDFGVYQGRLSFKKTIPEVNSNSKCSSWLASNKNNYQFLPSGAQGFYNSSDRACYFPLPASAYDSKISNFVSSGDSASFNASGISSDKACMQEAFCLGGRYTFSNGSCRITMPDESATEQYGELLLEEALKAAGLNSDENQIKSLSLEQMKAPIGGKEEIRSVMLDGLKSVFFFEDYIRGGWGWYSNHNAFPSEMNIVEVSEAGNAYVNLNTKEKKMSKITDLLNYRLALSHTWYKSKKPTLLGMLAFGAGLATPLIVSLGVVGGWAVNIIGYVIMAILAKSKDMDRQRADHHLYKDVPDEFYYPGLYETRMPEDREVLKKLANSEKEMLKKYYHYDVIKASSGGKLSENEDGIPRIAPLKEHMQRFTYWKIRSDTGKDEPDKVRKTLKKFKDQKNNIWGMLGILPSEIPFHSWENGNFGSNYPSCKWYNPWCEKSEGPKRDGYHTPNSKIPMEFLDFSEGEENDRQNAKVKVNVPLGDMTEPGSAINKIRKETTTVFLGATNGLTMLVPYRGDYNVIAYDRGGNKLSSFLVTEDMFVEKYNAMIPSAQVRFGDNMELALGMKEGANRNACRSDKAVEWGGGVSGTFFENQRTEESDFCFKSVDNYVKDHSMTSIEICPLNMDRCFKHDLKFPLPFPNRVWIASLNGKEIRNYRCYDDFSACSEDQFKTDNEGN